MGAISLFAGIISAYYRVSVLIRYVLIFLLGLSSIPSAKAIEPHFLLREINEEFAHLRIHLLYQDRNCMVWLGTQEGLIQYTGSQLIPVPFPDTTAVPVTAIYEDRNGILWAGTDQGLIYHYTPTEGLELWSPEEGLPKKKITAFTEDHAGQLWIATYGEGMYVVSSGHVYNVNVDDGLNNNEVYAVATDGLGRIWVGTDNGLNICQYNGKKEIVSLNTRDGLPDQIIRALASDGLGNIWIGMYEAGLAFYDVREDRISQVAVEPLLGNITCIALFDQLEIWIGTEDHGLWRYHLQQKLFTQIQSVADMREGEVVDLLRDVEGNIWVVSSVNTIHTAYRSFESMDLNIGSIQAIAVQSQEFVWLGTDNGLYKLWLHHLNGWVVDKITNAPFTSVAGLARDQFGNLWIGTLDLGLCVLQPGIGEFKTLKALTKMHLNPVISMFMKENTLWCATLGQGVLKATIDADVFQGNLPELVSLNGKGANKFVFQIFPGPENEATIATDGFGVLFAQSNQLLPPSVHDGIARTFYSGTYDHREHLWLSTPSEGLLEFDGKSFIPLDLDNGLRSVNISSLATTEKGEILIVHNKGIDALIPSRRHFIYFDDEVGIQSAVPVLNAISTDDHGNVWIGMQNKLVKYTSLDEELSIHPCTKIAQVSVNQVPVDFHHQNEFGANENFFSFDYTGLWYTSPSIVKYMYILEGHDKDWKESRDHIAIYSNLKPGNYVFRVKASENKYFYDEPLAEYAFRIRQPFWLTPWFLSLSALALLAISYLVIKNRDARVRRIELLNKEKIESQLMALKAQINPHFLFNSFNTLITIIDENTGNPDVPVEYVQKLADFYRSILQYREEELISIPEEIDLVKNYGYLLQKRYGDNLHLDIQTGSGHSGFIAPLTLQMLVENAVKHNIISKAKPLVIHIRIEEDYLVVENNVQKKLDEIQSTRFGLQSIAKRYALITERKVLVHETESRFKVSIPILKRK